MAVTVVIPYGGDCPHRAAALRWLRPRFPAGWQVLVGHHDTQPWCKAAAVADALRKATGDLLVIHDADAWCSETPAVVAQVDGWGMPHRRVHRLTEAATTAVLAGLEPHDKLGHAEKPYDGLWGGGIVAVRRDLYDDVPLDPRFAGWGQEDESWSFALGAVAGEGLRLDGRLFHLWHPIPERATRRIGNQAGRALGRRYWNARHNPDDMHALLEEVTCRTPST